MRSPYVYLAAGLIFTAVAIMSFVNGPLWLGFVDAVVAVVMFWYFFTRRRQARAG
jgi:K+-sensing histidine kinase KdpD